MGKEMKEVVVGMRNIFLAMRIWKSQQIEPILQTVWDICMGCKQYQPVKVKHNAINRCTREYMNCDDFSDKSLLSELPQKRGVNGRTT